MKNRDKLRPTRAQKIAASKEEKLASVPSKGSKREVATQMAVEALKAKFSK